MGTETNVFHTNFHLSFLLYDKKIIPDMGTETLSQSTTMCRPLQHDKKLTVFTATETRGRALLQCYFRDSFQIKN